MTDLNTHPKRIQYVPPPPELIDQIARDVCQSLAETNPAYIRDDVVNGFAAFLNVLARMEANRRNRLQEDAESHPLDTDSNQG